MGIGNFNAGTATTYTYSGGATNTNAPASTPAGNYVYNPPQEGDLDQDGASPPAGAGAVTAGAAAGAVSGNAGAAIAGNAGVADGLANMDADDIANPELADTDDDGNFALAAGAFGNIVAQRAGVTARTDINRAQADAYRTQNERVQTTLSFTPEVQQPPAVDPSDGISLAELDGGEFPVHARGVSIRKPELIGVFNFDPVFAGGETQGSGDNTSRILTDTGKFIDTQVNARKIRINDIESLFEQLSANPESPSGKITQNMIEVLEEKIAEANQDFATITEAAQSVSFFLGALNLKNENPALAQKFLQNRKKRFEKNPLLLPERFERAMDFRTILKKNHGFTESQINSFSSTKLFLYFLYDIRSLLMGPLENPNYPPPYRGLQSLKQRRSNIEPGRDNFAPRSSLAVGSESRMFAIPLVDLTDGYGRGKFGDGICSLVYSGEAAAALGSENDNSFLTQFDLVADSLPQTVLANTNTLYHQARAGYATGVIASTICTDLAFSSALGNNDFVARLKEDFPRTAESTKVADRITPVVPTYNDVGNARGAALLVANRTTLPGTVFYDDPSGDNINASKPVKIFDPSEPGPIQNGVQQIVTNTPYNKFLKPVIKSAADPDSQDQVLKEFLDNVPGRFKSAAGVMDYMFATDDPVLNPRALLLRVLTNIKNRVSELNISGDLDAAESLVTGPAIDFCVLAQSYRDAHLPTEIELSSARSTALAGNGSDGRKYYLFRTNDLLTPFVISLSKTYSGTGKYASCLPEAFDERSASSAGISLDLAKMIHLNLFNAFADGVVGQVANAFAISDNDSVLDNAMEDSSGAMKAYSSNFAGITRGSFEGEDLSPSRNTEGRRYTNWKKISSKLKAYLERVQTPSSTYAMPIGQLIVPANFLGHGSRGGRYGVGDPNDPRSTPTGHLRFTDGNSATPVKRIKGSNVRSRLMRVTGEAYDRSIFKDIVTDLDEIFQAAVSRGPIVDRSTGRMISSGVDPSYLASLLISMYGHIIIRLLGLYFVPQALSDGNNSRNRAVEQSWNGTAPDYESGDVISVMAISNINRARDFIRELNDFVDNGVAPDPGKPFGLFLREFDKNVAHNESVTLDTIDFFRSLGDQLQSSGESFLTSFQGSEEQTGNEESLERVRNILPLAIEPSQIASMRSQLNKIESKSGLDRYFDDFLVGKAQENFMYTLLSDTGPNRFYASNNQSAPRLEFNTQHGSNIDILTVGVPQGYSENILQINHIDDSEAFAERKIDVYVFTRDHIVGSGINIYPGKWTFELGLFPNQITDPVSSNSETRPEIENEQAIDFYNNVAGRPFPSADFALNNNITLKRVKVDGSAPDIITRTQDNADREIFDNHAYDILAKIYIKITTGMDVGEENFLLDTELERRAALDPDLTVLRSLLNTHLSSLLGKEVSFDDYLAGNRRFRELFQRLSTGKRTNQLVQEVKAKVTGATPEQDMLSSEDMVTFSRMISPKNPIITPGLMREKVTSPRTFERVFCLFLDPDKIRGLSPANSVPVANEVRRMYTNTAGLKQGGAGNNSAILNYDEARLAGDLKNIPRARAYEVLIVPHGTSVIAENAASLLPDFRDF